MARAWAAPAHSGRRGGRGRAGGFTLAEVLIALVVLVVGFLGFVGLIWGGFSTVQEAGRGTTALAAAESMIELVRSQPAAVIPQFDSVKTSVPTSCPGRGGTTVNTACQAWMTRVTALPNGGGTVAVATAPGAVTRIPFHTVSVTITWSEVSRGGKAITVVSGITD